MYTKVKRISFKFLEKSFYIVILSITSLVNPILMPKLAYRTYP